MKGVIYTMAKLKPLLPSLKEKKRYVSFEIIANNPLFTNNTQINNIVIKAIQPFLGSLTMAKAGIVGVDQKTKVKNGTNDTLDIPTKKRLHTGLLRVNHNYVNELKTAFTMIDTINDKPVMVRSLKVSGVLKKATA